MAVRGKSTDRAINGSIGTGFAPRSQVDGADHNTEQIRRNEAELSSPKPDHADDGTVDCGQSPALPAASSHKNGGRNRQQARYIIKTQHVGTPPEGIFCGNTRAFFCDCALSLHDGGHLTDAQCKGGGIPPPRRAKQGVMTPIARCVRNPGGLEAVTKVNTEVERWNKSVLEPRSGDM